MSGAPWVVPLRWAAAAECQQPPAAAALPIFRTVKVIVKYAPSGSPPRSRARLAKQTYHKRLRARSLHSDALQPASRPAACTARSASTASPHWTRRRRPPRSASQATAARPLRQAPGGRRHLRKPTCQPWRPQRRRQRRWRSQWQTRGAAPPPARPSTRVRLSSSAQAAGAFACTRLQAQHAHAWARCRPAHVAASRITLNHPP